MIFKIYDGDPKAETRSSFLYRFCLYGINELNMHLYFCLQEYRCMFGLFIIFILSHMKASKNDAPLRHS